MIGYVKRRREFLGIISYAKKQTLFSDKIKVRTPVSSLYRLIYHSFESGELKIAGGTNLLSDGIQKWIIRVIAILARIPLD